MFNEKRETVCHSLQRGHSFSASSNTTTTQALQQRGIPCLQALRSSSCAAFLPDSLWYSPLHHHCFHHHHHPQHHRQEQQQYRINTSSAADGGDAHVAADLDRPRPPVLARRGPGASGARKRQCRQGDPPAETAPLEAGLAVICIGNPHC